MSTPAASDLPATGQPDPRVTPYRPDLAAAFLKGRVEAERFVEGVPCQVRTGFASLAEGPGPHRRQASQLLHGETFTVYEEQDGWAWGQGGTDGYVGWVALAALDAEVTPPTHRVTALRTFVFPAPDLKTPPLDMLSLEGRVSVAGRTGEWLELAGGGFVHARHVAPVDAAGEPDIATTAARFIGTPYLWGGRSSIGIDCSGLVQLALAVAGLPCPRDSDQQQAAVGMPVSLDGWEKRRGDLVFFPGHVGIMADAVDLIHANAFHMAVVRESLADVLARAGDKGITAVKRLG